MARCSSTVRGPRITTGAGPRAVYTTLQACYSADFGFTEPEVGELAKRAGATDDLPVLREWYNGYQVGPTTVYNPWSVLNFLDDPERQPISHWANTGGDTLLREILLRDGLGTLEEQETLLGGDSVTKPVGETITLRDLDAQGDAVWGFLLFSGYLTATEVSYEGAETRAVLRLPNREVRGLFERVFIRWLRAAMGRDGLDVLVRALLAGDAEATQHYLTRVLTEQASYNDFPRSAGEAVYHAFVLGLLVRLAADYEVRSNRESGFGRADVLVIPRRRGEPGVVMELKVLGEGAELAASLDAAHAQIAERDYAAELRARGAEPVHSLAVVFDGKRAHVRAG